MTNLDAQIVDVGRNLVEVSFKNLLISQDTANFPSFAILDGME
jgi:hypothetical protein